MIDWYIEGVEFGNCNCGYACRCQFEDRPTHDHCRGFELVRNGRHSDELVKEFDPSAWTIRNWVAQADRDEGLRNDGRVF